MCTIACPSFPFSGVFSSMISVKPCHCLSGKPLPGYVNPLPSGDRQCCVTAEEEQNHPAIHDEGLVIGGAKCMKRPLDGATMLFGEIPPATVKYDADNVTVADNMMNRAPLPPSPAPTMFDHSFNFNKTTTAQCSVPMPSNMRLPRHARLINEMRVARSNRHFHADRSNLSAADWVLGLWGHQFLPAVGLHVFPPKVKLPMPTAFLPGKF